MLVLNAKAYELIYFSDYSLSYLFFWISEIRYVALIKVPIVSLIGKTLKWFINDTNLSDKSHCKYYYSIINHNIAQWLISQTLHSDVLKLLFKDFIAKNSLICSATFFCFTKYNITSEKRCKKSMKFNFISINSNFGKHDSEENKFSWIELNLQQD